MSNSTGNKITLQEAIDWTRNWRQYPSTQARAFLIPLQDLEGLLQEMSNQTGDPNACVRAYLAMDENGAEKLVFVGTEQDKTGVYRDLLPNTLDNADDDGFSVWDFTRPCPPKCDDQSDLN